jgi:hypothetical protein
MTQITGGCLGGAVRYSADAEPIPGGTVLTYCSTCQRHSGTAFASIMAFPAGSITVAGPLKTYTEPGGQSGQPFHRRFCAECGTPPIWEREGADRALITAGTLDDKSLFRPRIAIFCASAQPWVPITQDTENYPSYL